VVAIPALMLLWIRWSGSRGGAAPSSAGA
jgi:hypothetical protein